MTNLEIELRNRLIQLGENASYSETAEIVKHLELEIKNRTSILDSTYSTITIRVFDNDNYSSHKLELIKKLGFDDIEYHSALKCHICIRRHGVGVVNECSHIVKKLIEKEVGRIDVSTWNTIHNGHADIIFHNDKIKQVNCSSHINVEYMNEIGKAFGVDLLKIKEALQ
ncbi:MAG: hypothetical protein ACRDDY_03320 [Clostridium sp.]|uniref:hypothetical protein n=1 Tax=Clostridium sp. TaxID=1506 RepID=UPI003EE5FF42